MLLASGCANVMPHQAGQVVGAIVGSAVAPGIGTPIGSLLGALAGLIVQREVNQSTEQHERVELGRQVKPTGASEPFGPVLAGLLGRVWVDETVHTGRVLAGHFESHPLP